MLRVMSIRKKVPSCSWSLWHLVAVAAVVLVFGACASLGRQADRSAAAGNWDAAVEYYERAVQEDPDRAEYRIALQRAKIAASRGHIEAGRAFENQRELSAALREYRVAAEFDPSNSEVVARAANLDLAIRTQIEADRPPPPITAMRAQARLETLPPLLNPASRDLLVFDFRETSLRDLMDFIGDATGINVAYDEQFQDRQVTIRIDGLTLEEALDHVLSTNQSFFKVLNPRSIIVAPSTPQKRAQYAEQVIRTFYVSHADVQELSQLLTQVVRVPQMAVQPAVIPNTLANTITVRATTEVAAIIEQVISANDKPAAEIIIDVEILEVSRERAKQAGLNLAEYALGGVFSPETSPSGGPFGASDNDSFSSFNLNTVSQGVSTADFYLGVPAAVVRFLETDANTKIVAKPQLRGQEGQTMTLNLGEDIPVPTTAFTAIATGGATVNPLTSFIYRPVGVIVEMTPRVTYEGEIILELVLENSTLGANIAVAGTSLPTFGSRRVETQLRLRDGESNLLAGLLREEDRNTFRGFPGLSRVPLLRSLFGYTETQVRQTDIVMLLTPRVVRTHELTQRDISPIHIGTEARFGLTGAPPLIASQPDAGVPDAPGLDTTSAESPTDAPLASPEPTPAADVSDVDPEAPTEPESALPPPTAQPQTPPGASGVSAGAQVLVTPPSVQLRVGGGPYTLPISITGVSQLSTISLTVVFDPSVLRVRTVLEGSFMQQGGLQVTFVPEVDAATGRIDLTVTRMNDSTGASGAGLLAAVLFDAISVGSVTFTTSGNALTPGGAPIGLEFMPTTVTTQ